MDLTVQNTPLVASCVSQLSLVTEIEQSIGDLTFYKMIMANPYEPNFNLFVNGIFNTLFSSAFDLDNLEEKETENVVLQNNGDCELGVFVLGLCQ